MDEVKVKETKNEQTYKNIKKNKFFSQVSLVEQVNNKREAACSALPKRIFKQYKGNGKWNPCFVESLTV